MHCACQLLFFIVTQQKETNSTLRWSSTVNISPWVYTSALLYIKLCYMSPDTHRRKWKSPAGSLKRSQTNLPYKLHHHVHEHPVCSFHEICYLQTIKKNSYQRQSLLNVFECKLAVASFNGILTLTLMMLTFPMWARVLNLLFTQMNSKWQADLVLSTSFTYMLWLGNYFLSSHYTSAWWSSSFPEWCVYMHCFSYSTLAAC